jgi:LacI family transcriptional regulator
VEQQKNTRRAAVTISDVAASIGVATSTVSRALTQPDRVSAPTRRRVLEAAQLLGYVANSQARSLTTGRTQTIALVVPDITNPFFFDLIRGTQSQASARGYRQVLIDTQESPQLEAAQIAEMRNSIDGFLLSATRLDDDALAALAEHQPVVLINRESPGIPSVIIDTPSGMSQAIDHLVSLGHASVVYVGGPATSWSSEQRWRAVRESADRLGITATTIGPFSPTIQAGAAAADATIRTGATACLFFNDLLAIGAMRRFAERGIRVPQDMSVVGCDDIFGADFVNPPLTTVTNPIEHAGRVAIDMLVADLRAGDSALTPGRTQHVLPSHLTIRQSTGAVGG